MKAMKKHNERMIFTISIDFNDTYRRELEFYRSQARSGNSKETKYAWDLRPDRIYLDRDNDRKFSYDDIVSKIGEIANRFKSKCNENNGAWMEMTEVKLLGIQEGSIKVTLSVLTTLFDVAGGIKNIYDCAEIVRNMLSSHFEEELARKFKARYFKVDTTVLAPTGNGKGTNNVFACEEVKYKRDAFFYYLLVSNFALLATIGLLVFKAVSNMYW